MKDPHGRPGLLPTFRGFATAATWLGRSLAPSALGDRLFRGLCSIAAFLVIVLAGLLVVVLLWKSWLAIQTVGIRFLTSTTWDPEPTHRIFGALAFVYGTLISSTLAMVIAAPLGIGSAACLSEIAPR